MFKKIFISISMVLLSGVAVADHHLPLWPTETFSTKRVIECEEGVRITIFGREDGVTVEVTSYGGMNIVQKMYDDSGLKEASVRDGNRWELVHFVDQEGVIRKTYNPRQAHHAIVVFAGERGPDVLEAYLACIPEVDQGVENDFEALMKDWSARLQSFMGAL